MLSYQIYISVFVCVTIKYIIYQKIEYIYNTTTTVSLKISPRKFMLCRRHLFTYLEKLFGN